MHRNIYLSKKYHNLNTHLLAQKIFYEMFHLGKAGVDFSKQKPKYKIISDPRGNR